MIFSEDKPSAPTVAPLTLSVSEGSVPSLDSVAFSPGFECGKGELQQKLPL